MVATSRRAANGVAAPNRYHDSVQRPSDDPRATLPVVQGHGRVHDELRIGGIRIVEVSHGAGLCLAGHAHDTAKICILLEGGVSERCGLDILSPGVFEPVFRRAHAPHANQYHAHGARSLLVEIAPDSRLGRVATEGLPHERARGRTLARALVAALVGPPSSRPRLVGATLHAMLEAFQIPRPRPPAWLDAAREALALQSSAPPLLEDLARTLGVHPVYLAQTFRARWGTTTRAFVRAHRVFHAMQLVDAGSPLAQAAVAAGFADQSHMTRAIRRDRRAAPGELRRSRRSRH
jgi:AraC family transcriptional regulator